MRGDEVEFWYNRSLHISLIVKGIGKDLNFISKYDGKAWRVLRRRGDPVRLPWREVVGGQDTYRKYIKNCNDPKIKKKKISGLPV